MLVEKMVKKKKQRRIKKIINAIWLECLTIIFVVGVGILLCIIISPSLFFLPLIAGITLIYKPYIKIRMILENKI